MLSKAEIQRLRSLREKKHREELGLFVIEGEKVVGELLAANFNFSEIYATADWTNPIELPAGPNSSPNVVRISDDEMARASHFPTPSSVLAVGHVRHQPLAPRALEQGLTLALDGVQDAGNVGTLLRVAEWFGLDRVLLSPDCADLFHQKVINGSMGSFARLHVHTVDLTVVLEDVAHVPVLGCDLTGKSVHTLGALDDAIIVIGSEGRGISPAVREHITEFVTIPRYGGAESLNAGIAAAIVCDNLRRSQ